MLRIPTLSEITEVAQGRGHNSEAPEQWDGCVGLWSFQEGAGTKAFDLSGYGNHGTLNNMDPATDWVASPYGRALDFDDDYVSLLNFRWPPEFTVAAVIYADTPTSSDWCVSMNVGSGYRAFGIESGKWAMLHRKTDGTSLYWATTASPATDSAWHVLVWRHSEVSGGTLFLDGASILTNAGTGSESEAVFTGTLKLGGGDATRYWDGRISCVTLHDLPLPDSIIRVITTDPFAHLRLRRRVYPVAALSAFGGKSYILGGGNSCILGV